MPAEPLRIFGSYAIVCLLHGQGTYRDALGGIETTVNANDVILIFPERPHTYGPQRGRPWSELYVVFDGPIFDLYRQARFLDDTRTIYNSPEGWIDSLHSLLDRQGRSSGTTLEHTRLVSDFSDLLKSLCRRDELPLEDADVRDASALWVRRARVELETELGETIDLAAIARQAGMTYETFRKRFQREVGVSPAHYRMQRRIAAARELIQYAPRTPNRQVAEMLGFADAYHFSKTFTRLTGATPRDFRRETSAEVE